MASGNRSLTLMVEIDRICDRFEAAWRSSGGARIEDYLDDRPLESRDELLMALLGVELELRRRIGEKPSPEEYRLRFPDLGRAVEKVFAAGGETVVGGSASAANPFEQELSEFSVGGSVLNPTVVEADAPSSAGMISIDLEATRGEEGATAEYAGDLKGPESIGRYRLQRILGKGGFGLVHLAYDSALKRLVAVKVPKEGVLSTTRQYQSFRAEAQMAGRLKHPGIVTVYDIGRDESGRVFVVMEYIDGRTLSRLLRYEKPALEKLIEIMIEVAAALEYAHARHLVHRDLKPSNILIDKEGKAHVGDFGLAAKIEGPERRCAGVAGTPAYMAPEQIRGEMHRLDRRTDIWAFGVLLYEILTGKLPFEGSNDTGILQSVVSEEPIPPRQINERAPRELENICLRCLSKRMDDRYPSASAAARDLRHWLTRRAEDSTEIPTEGIFRVAPILRGLRPFDEEDAGFFLSLLPGPRDREGLPESIRFWKIRIESPARAECFSVGLLYGPSGCGKSSLVRAGILPRLAPSITRIYLEATPKRTEARLLEALRAENPKLRDTADLAAAIAELRTREKGGRGGKVLLVIDQFEQWLYANAIDPEAELVRALRQCDGSHVQALLLLRDDFWMGITRFMRCVEVGIEEKSNSMAVEPFSPAHSRKVLLELGRAGGRLPIPPARPTPAEELFLDNAIKELAENGRVNSVRLVLFAEMLKRRPWRVETLRELGGIEGIGAKFLEESFSGATASPAARTHSAAAERVLAELLPGPSSLLKGKSRSSRELQLASGYRDRPDDFAELMRLLDGELRLVTPADPTSSEAAAVSEEGGPAFQLTHDYLVPSLRQWLSEKQTSTRKGRARTRLQLVTAHWRLRPESRLLPSFLEWLGILVHIRPGECTPDERRMMKAANAHYAARIALTGVLVAASLLIAMGIRRNYDGGLLFARALNADSRSLVKMLPELEKERALLDDRFVRLEADDNASERDRGIATAWLYRKTPTEGRAKRLRDRLFAAPPDEIELLRQTLASGPGGAGSDSLFDVVNSGTTAPDSRLRAGCALAILSPDDARWSASAPVVARALLDQDRRSLGFWLELLEPVLPRLLPELEAITLSVDLEATTRETAAEAVAEALGRRQEVERLFEDALRVQKEAFRPLITELKRVRDRSSIGSILSEYWIARAGAAPPEQREEIERIAYRDSAALVIGLAMGETERVWEGLRHRPDPRLRSMLIERLADPTVDAKDLIAALDRVGDEPAMIQGVLLAFAEMEPVRRAALPRDEILEKTVRLYRNAADPGVHAAADLLLRRWDAAPPSPGLRPINPVGERGWAVGANGHELVWIKGPVEFAMGSPPGESRREPTELLHHRRIPRSFAIGAKEVTYKQFTAFRPQHLQNTEFGRTRPESPVNGVSWFEAVAYCNWLSDQEGLERVYPNPVEGKITLKGGEFAKSGYRLPSEAEFEYCCRAGTITSRPYGDTETLIIKYAWTFKNSEGYSHRVGRLPPNEFGLFDAIGNMWEWCHEWFNPPAFHIPYPTGTSPDKPAVDSVDVAGVADNSVKHMVRGGGSYDYGPYMARSAKRYEAEAWNNYPYMGFRVARTIPEIKR